MAHFTPLLRQLFQVQEDGLLVDLLMALPPRLIAFDTDTTDPAVHRPAWMEVPEVEDGRRVYITTTPNVGHDPARPLEVCVTGVQMKICLNITMDGGTWAAASGPGASMGSEQNSFLHGMNRQEQQQPYEVVWLEEGDCLKTRSPDEATFRHNCYGNRRPLASKLEKLTRPPLRRVKMNQVPATGTAVTSRGDAEQQDMEAEDREHAQQQDARAAGNAEVMEYACASLRAIKFDLATYFDTANVNGESETGYGITVPVTRRTLVRMLCTASPRILAAPAWEELPVDQYAALCILHDVMRCGEHLWTLWLAALLSLYESGKSALIDRLLNRVLSRMKLRRIAKNKDTGYQPPAASLHSQHHPTTAPPPPHHRFFIHTSYLYSFILIPIHSGSHSYLYSYFCSYSYLYSYRNADAEGVA